jgi:hypothetical protein
MKLAFRSCGKEADSEDATADRAGGVHHHAPRGLRVIRHIVDGPVGENDVGRALGLPTYRQGARPAGDL